MQAVERIILVTVIRGVIVFSSVIGSWQVVRATLEMMDFGQTELKIGWKTLIQGLVQIMHSVTAKLNMINFMRTKNEV